MAAWDVADWSLDDNLQRLRNHYGEQWFPPDLNVALELGADGEGTFNLLTSSGIDDVIAKGSLVLYVGDDGGHATPWVDRLFEYDFEAIEAAAAVNDDDPGDQGPDDPTWMAPTTGVALWAGEVRDVYSLEVIDNEGEVVLGDDGLALRRTFILMTGYINVRDLIRSYPQRWERLIDVVEFMHPREHLKTDLWEATRPHYIVAVGAPSCVSEARPSAPPPLAATTVARVFTIPGAVHNLDPVRNSVRRRRLEFRRCPGFQHTNCAVEGCQSPAYNRRLDTIAYCTNCGAWFHPACADTADPQDNFDVLRVEWTGGMLDGPMTRRTPNTGDAVMVPAARGLLVRVDPPVRTWERAAGGIDSARSSVENVEDSDGTAFVVALRDEVRLGGVFGGSLREEEIDEVLGVLNGGGPQDGWDLLVCPFCGENA